MRLPWLVRFLWQPEVELDMLDKEGKPDHGKIMGYYLVTCFMVMAVTNTLPSIGELIVLASVGFGWIMFRTFLSAHVGAPPPSDFQSDE